MNADRPKESAEQFPAPTAPPPVEQIRILSPRDGGETHSRSFTVQGTHTQSSGSATVVASGVASGSKSVTAVNNAWSADFTAKTDGSVTVVANAPSVGGDTVTFTVKTNPEMTFNAPTLSGGNLTVSGQCTLAGVAQVDVTVAKRNGAGLDPEQTQRVNVVTNAFTAVFGSMTAGTFLIGSKAVGGTLMSSKLSTV